MTNVFDVKKFSQELVEEFLEDHPALKKDDSVLAEFVVVMAEVSAAAIAKYERENTR